MESGLNSLWDYALAAVAAVGGVGVIILGISGWVAKIWTNRIMHDDLYRHNQAIEALKARLSDEAEHYKTRLRKSELLFAREFCAANDLVKLVDSIEFGYNDPWMDDFSSFIDHVESERNAIADSIEKFLARHAAILSYVVRDNLKAARASCLLVREGEVPGGADAIAESKNCYKRLIAAQAELLKIVRDQASTAPAVDRSART